MKKKKDKKTFAEQKEASELRDLQEQVAKFGKTEPTRYFNEGDRVVWGRHKEVYVEEVLFEGYAYKLRSIYHKDKNARSEIAEGTVSFGYQLWVDVFPYDMFITNDTNFSVEDKINLVYMNCDISSLFAKHYYFGVDYSPEYQREYVWALEDKVSLIDSIMHNVDIGKFTFIKLSYEEAIKRVNKSNYEILDGKQRMNAITDFYEDRFVYRGKKFSELSFKDRHKFTNHHISFVEIERLTREQILRTFIKLNTTGKVMDASHIEKVRQEWLKTLEESK